MIQVEEIEKRIAQAMPEAEVVVQDLTGTSDHFQALVISDAFGGKTMIQQHQMVYQALGDLMKEAIHALAIKTFTPEQWKNQ